MRRPLTRSLQRLRNQQQLAGSGATLHIRVCPRGFGKRIGTANPHLQDTAGNPVEQLGGMRLEQRRRVNMVGEAGVANLDTPRQAQNVERSWTAQNWPIPAESAAAAEGIERGLESHRPRPVVDDVNTLATRQANYFTCE